MHTQGVGLTLVFKLKCTVCSVWLMLKCSWYAYPGPGVWPMWGQMDIPLVKSPNYTYPGTGLTTIEVKWSYFRSGPQIIHTQEQGFPSFILEVKWSSDVTMSTTWVSLTMGSFQPIYLPETKLGTQTKEEERLSGTQRALKRSNWRHQILWQCCQPTVRMLQMAKLGS